VSDAPYLRIENVVKRFAPGAAAAVDGVSLAVARGEFFALLGPSGCGKTTLLRMLAGFERPDQGRILIDGADMADVPTYRRPVNMMFQSYALFPHMTAAQNVGFGLKQDGLPRREIKERVAAMLDLVKLGRLGDRKPHQLSGGERQRAAVARALVTQPRVVLADEPTGNLDGGNAEAVFALMLELNRERGTSLVVVTHDLRLAARMERVYELERGTLSARA
jgi:putrescine transport system ATP-binding protein